MRKKIFFILLALAMSCSLVLAVACEEKGGETPAPGPDDESVVYEGDMLYNGFEDQGDLYRIKQLFDWDYTPLGKLEIVDYNHPDVFAYRHRGSSTIMVVSNFRPYQTYFTFNYEIGDIVLHNYDGVLLKDHVFTLRPFECYLLKIR